MLQLRGRKQFEKPSITKSEQRLKAIYKNQMYGSEE